MKKVLAFAMAGVVLAGCDFELPSQRRAREEALRRETVAKEEKKVEKEQAQGECAALQHHVGMQLGIVKSSRADVEKALAQLKEDRKTLSARLTELSEKSMADKTGTRATALYAVLKDEGVNAVALKYLGSDFAVVRNEFAEKMRFAIKQEQERKAALDRNRAEYERAVEESRTRVDESRQSISAALVRIKQEISETDQRLKRLRNDLSSASPTEKKNKQYAIVETESHLAALRSRYTSMLTSDSASRQGRDADSAAANVRNRALWERERADRVILEKTKNMVTPFQVAEEYEGRTIRRLDTVLREKDLFAQAQLKLMNEQVTFLTHVTNGLETLSLSGLKRVRADVDAMLAKKPQVDEEAEKQGKKR